MGGGDPGTEAEISTIPPKKAKPSSSNGLDPKALATKLAKAIGSCITEEDLRVNMEHVLRDALPELPNPKYEKSIKASTFSGRADAVHRGLVIEYEKPQSMRREAKRKEAVGQVCDYVTGLTLGDAAKSKKNGLDSKAVYSQEEEEKLSANVGLATDGERFIFIQRRGKTWHTDIRKLDEDTVERLVLWLRAMSRKDLSPENLIADFGPAAKLAEEVVGVFAKLVASRKYPKANVIYEEWRRIFGIVYGADQLKRTKKDPEAKAITAAYHLKLGVDFPVLLFAVHTYYALFMKLLATEVIVASGSITDSFIGALARTKLKKQLSELESGEILQRHNIRNAIEQDFFGWYPEAWTTDLQGVLWKFIQTLAAYDIGTFQLKPDRARDLLKDLYHGLIPESVRHALGEYYTPDWLAEHTIDLAGYGGDPKKTFLDPACGSGTFLVMAIHKVRQWLADRSVDWGSNKKKQEAVDLIRHNIVGFDLNPLAVIASRTNYLFALGPLLRYRTAGTDFEIPVYLTDSVLLPGRTEFAPGLFAMDTVAFPMTVGTFNLPTKIVETRQVPDLMNLLHDSIADGQSCDAFVKRSMTQLKLGSDKAIKTALETLFRAMADLDKEGKNRVWAKLIRNRYAALFFRHYFDFVVGNPPHVNWESLTPDWRKAAEGEYKRYGLFTLKGLASRHGGGKKDIAALFTYAVLDHFVKADGILALVVHVSLFKTSGAAEGYRRFQLGDSEHFRVEVAHDFKSFQPFQTHAKMKIKTRTVTFRATKGEKTKYPVPYTVWHKTKKGFIPGNLTWVEADRHLSSTLVKATPLRGTTRHGRLSPWLTVPAAKLPQSRKVTAPTTYVPEYAGHAGFYSGGLNGAFFLQVVDTLPAGTLRVRNMHGVGKKKCPSVEATIEADLVYPLLRGRTVARWHTEDAGHVLIVQDPKTKKGFPEHWMQTTHPLTWAYLKKFEALLRKRAAFKKYFDPAKDPFYSMYDIGSYTFSEHKVLWMDVSANMKAAVVSGRVGNDMPMPEHKLMLLATHSADEAHYVAAVLNSEPVDTVIAGYIVDNSVSTHPIDNVVIPKFDPKNRTHTALALLSRHAHKATTAGKKADVVKAEAAINKEVLSLW